jgi:NAD(P)-dependent dehydrogenase (short-subunit alcohol dehydrogenase family)
MGIPAANLKGSAGVSRLTGKVALVTGGASGIGRAIAERLASDGAQVLISDVQTALGQSVAAERHFEFFSHDVVNENQWLELMRRIVTSYGGLHILVNNAGILSPPSELANPETSALSDWRRIFAVNVEGVFLGCKTAIPAMHATGGGSIINMSSVAALLATPFATAYGASKASVRQLTKSVAQYCAERRLNIRCNSVHPGIVRTAALDKAFGEAAAQRGVGFEVILTERQSAVPVGEFAQLQEIAAAVAFLASDESRHMTGAELVIDGGLVACDTYHNTGLTDRG